MKRMFRGIVLVLLGILSVGLLVMAIKYDGDYMVATEVRMSALSDVPAQRWKDLAQRRIYFGHQSVGGNLMQGVQEVLSEHPEISLDVVETRDPRAFDRPVFAHSTLGDNRDPTSKCDAFRQVMVDGVGELVDIAFVKFCYVDIAQDTDIEALFTTYESMVQEVEMRFPSAVIVHVTVPLKAMPGGPKGFVKHMLGRDGALENVRRDQFNSLLRSQYDGKEPLFDLALFESMAPDGRQSVFSYQGYVYPSLYSGYTDDGGHLNEPGRRHVATQLLVFLAMQMHSGHADALR